MDNISLGIRFTDLRIEMGLTQRDIADRMSVSEKIIIELEKGQLTNAPIVFVKNYVRSYAKIVGLSSDEYEVCLDALSQQMMSEQAMKYSKVVQNNRTKWLIRSFLAIFCLLSATGYYIWSTNQNKNNFVEVIQYISPSFSARANI